MLSPLRANHLARLPSLSLNCTRNFAISNEVRKKRGRPLVPPLKTFDIASNEVSKPAVAPQHGDSLATSLDHYSSLPPLPPNDDWLSYFSCVTPPLRDRISIRAPASAINVARSFINSKKTSTNKPKVIVEAFPGVCHLKAVVTLVSYPV